MTWNNSASNDVIGYYVYAQNGETITRVATIRTNQTNSYTIESWLLLRSRCRYNRLNRNLRTQLQSKRKRKPPPPETETRRIHQTEETLRLHHSTLPSGTRMKTPLLQMTRKMKNDQLRLGVIASDFSN